MQLPNNSVVLVADGRKSLFFRNAGDGEFPNLALEDKAEFANPAHHEQATDTAECHETADGRGGSMEEVESTSRRKIAVAADLPRRSRRGRWPTSSRR